MEYESILYHLPRINRQDYQITFAPFPEIVPGMARYEDFALEGYDPLPHIKAAVAV